MANVKKGHLSAARQWWKHLRWTKREFWKAERQAKQREIAQQVADNYDRRIIAKGYPTGSANTEVPVGCEK